MNRGTSGSAHVMPTMQDQFLPAIFFRVCVLISVRIVQDSGAEILCIKMNSFWEN
jgi:hypothetical protein